MSHRSSQKGESSSTGKKAYWDARETYIIIEEGNYDRYIFPLLSFSMEDSVRERDFQARLIKNLRSLLPGVVILKNDSSYMQGMPDLTILYKDKWAVLEVKAKAGARHQPNQEYYVGLLNEMSYAAFVHPENEGEVLDAIQETFGVS